MFRILVLFSFLLVFFNCGSESSSESSSEKDSIQFGKFLYFLNASNFKPTIRVVIDKQSSADIKFEALLELLNKDGKTVQIKTLQFDIVKSVGTKEFIVEPQEGVVGDKVVKTIEITKISLNNKSISETKTISFEGGMSNLEAFIEFGNSLFYKDGVNRKIDFAVKKKVTSNIVFKSLLTLRNSSGSIVQLKNLDFTIDRSTDIETFTVEPKAGLIGDDADVATADITDIELNGVVTGVTHKITLGSK